MRERAFFLLKRSNKAVQTPLWKAFTSGYFGNVNVKKRSPEFTKQFVAEMYRKKTPKPIDKGRKLQGKHNFHPMHHTTTDTFLSWGSAENTLVFFLLFVLPTCSVHFSLCGRPLHMALVVSPSLSCYEVIKCGAGNTASLLSKETRTLKYFKGFMDSRCWTPSPKDVCTELASHWSSPPCTHRLHAPFVGRGGGMLSMYWKNHLSWDFCEF